MRGHASRYNGRLLPPFPCPLLEWVATLWVMIFTILYIASCESFDTLDCNLDALCDYKMHTVDDHNQRVCTWRSLVSTADVILYNYEMISNVFDKNILAFTLEVITLVVEGPVVWITSCGTHHFCYNAQISVLIMKNTLLNKIVGQHIFILQLI